MSKRYRVIGSQPILDHKQGETFDADLPVEQERFFLSIGAIIEVAGAGEGKTQKLAAADIVENEIKVLNVRSHQR